MSHKMILVTSSLGDIWWIVGIVIGAIAMHFDETQYIHKSPYFVVTEMVQCKGNICNAVLDMDALSILIPYDSTTVHVGDKLYLVK